MWIGSPGRVCGWLGTFPKVFLRSLFNSEIFPSSPLFPLLLPNWNVMSSFKVEVEGFARDL